MTEVDLRLENETLRVRLEEAEDTLRAIRSGTVDAVVVGEADRRRVYTLDGADRAYRVWVGQMSQGAATLTSGGTVIYCNPRLALMLGVPAEKLPGRPLQDFVPASEQSGYNDLFRTGVGQAELALTQDNGATVPVLVTLNSLPPESGAAFGALVTDLTAQKHHEKLAAVVTALKESEERLARLYDALTEQDRRKDEFLATLAHELRNPLAPIRSSLSILRLGRIGSNNDKLVSMMERQLGQLVHLVDDLLDVSRVTSGKIALRRERVELREVVEAAVETSRPVVEQGGHRLTTSLPDESLPLDADRTRLTQVLTNILNNSAKYTPDGGRIELSAVKEGGTAVVRVTDSGIGLAVEMLPKVFDMFTQVGSSLERSQGGLGLGLTLVRRLVEMHEGTVTADSPGVGRGSTFTVRLPLASHPGARPAPQPDAPQPRPTSMSHRVLVVDDNSDAAESLAILIRLLGHETRTAYSGPTGIEVAVGFSPDVVFLDIGLPGMNGYDVAMRLRKEPSLVGTMLVALTGWGSDEDQQRSSEAGFDYHLTKPVEIERVCELLGRLPPR
jgi:signal transduction histidine kinase